MLLIRSIADLPSITSCPAKQKLPRLVVANALRHLQLIRADRKPGSSHERTLNDATRQGSRIPDPARPPSLERCVASPIRRQRGVDSGKRVQVDLRRSDDAAWLSRLDAACCALFAAYCSIWQGHRALLLFSPVFAQSFLQRPLCLTRKPFRHSPLPTPYIRTLCLHRIGASTYTGFNSI